jgi:hypothetical protein
MANDPFKASHARVDGGCVGGGGGALLRCYRADVKSMGLTTVTPFRWRTIKIGANTLST